MRNTDMGDAAFAKEAFLAREGPVNELIYNDKIAGGHLFAKASAGRNRDHIGDTNAFQRVDVGAIRHRAGRMHMAPPVARQKGHFHAVQSARQDLVRRRAPWGFNGGPFRAVQPVDLIYPRAADHGDHCVGHLDPNASVASAFCARFWRMARWRAQG